MWPFKPKQPTVEDLRGYKMITVNGMRFTIKKLNPVLDFPTDKIPQIFTDYQTVKDAPRPPSTLEAVKKSQTEMYDTIQAGVVDPKIVPVGKEGGFTPEDLFRDPTMGLKLYYAIIENSLNQFTGINKLFFSIGIKLSLLTHYASGTVRSLATWSFPKERPV